MATRVLNGGLWSVAANWTDSIKAIDGDAVEMTADSVLDEDHSAGGLDITLSGFTYTGASKLSYETDQDRVLRLADGASFTPITGGELEMHPDASHVHKLELNPATDGNCVLALGSGFTLDLIGDEGWRRNSGTGWSAQLFQDASATDTELFIKTDLDLNATQVAAQSLKLVLEPGGISYTQYEERTISGYAYDAGVGAWKITITVGLTYASYEDVWLHIVTRNVQLVSAGAADWNLDAPTGALLDCTEVLVENEREGYTYMDTMRWTRCSFVQPGGSRDYLFYRGKGGVWDDCFFLVNYIIATLGQTYEHGGTFNDCVGIVNVPSSWVGVNWTGGRVWANIGFSHASQVSNAYVKGYNYCVTFAYGIVMRNCTLHTTNVSAETVYVGKATLIDCDIAGSGWKIAAYCEIVSINHDQVDGDHRYYYFGAIVQMTTSVKYTGNVGSLEIDTGDEAWSAEGPLWVPLSSYRVKMGDAVTFKCRCTCDDDYWDNADDKNPKVVLFRGGELHATGTEQTDAMTLTDPDVLGGGPEAADWIQGEVSGTVESAGTGWVTLTAWLQVPGNAGILYAGDFLWSGATEDGDNIRMWPDTVVGEAAAGGGGGLLTHPGMAGGMRG